MNPSREQMEFAKKELNGRIHADGADHLDEAISIALSALNALLNAGEVFVKPNYANYYHFEKYAECEHKKTDTVGWNCQACDIAWLIERCKGLEKARSEDIAILARKISGIEKIVAHELYVKFGWRKNPTAKKIALAITQHLKGKV